MSDSRGRFNRFAPRLYQLAFVCIVLTVWEAAATLRPAPYLPHLVSVGSGVWVLLHGQTLTEQVVPSLYRFLVGFGAGVAAGGLIGAAIGFFQRLEPWVRPVLEFLRATPVAAILPAALMILGATNTMRISIIAFGSSFPVILAAIDGARRVDSVMLDTARVSGLTGGQILRQVIVPASLPQVFAGIRTSLGIALIMMVISELLAANRGLGNYILENQRLFESADVYAGVIVIGLIGWAVTLGMLRLEGRVLAWHHGSRGATGR